MARIATRLHPRPGNPSPRDSSVGGPLLWPASEPWPHCDGPHALDGLNPARSLADVRLERRIRAAAHGRSMTPQELETLRRIHPLPGPVTKAPVAQPYDGSIAMLAVAQLYARDVPGLRASAGADLLQVLWCPFDHPGDEEFMPKTALFWRSADTVADILTVPPEPAEVQYEGYVPEPCLLDPEQITEYPSLPELSEDLREPLGRWSTWQAAGVTPDSSYAIAPQEFYDNELSAAPGWKAGGWIRWGLTDPYDQPCPVCGTPAEPLLTIAWTEWDDSTHSWIPHEDRAAGISSSAYPAQPSGIQIARGYGQIVRVCPASPGHPHVQLMQ
ncbi:MAG: hypothetical protein JOY82_17970 [Streptosporangiaceae bacterium]|nr:hypothetical protein [Streptosporangiaceae bacterium]MBV9856375.1 hypothetical protein [Streptosporangiaceae bacterium]